MNGGRGRGKIAAGKDRIATWCLGAYRGSLIDLISVYNEILSINISYTNSLYRFQKNCYYKIIKVLLKKIILLENTNIDLLSDYLILM